MDFQRGIHRDSHRQPQSPYSDERKNIYCPKSPEFEFWKIRNPFDPQPDLLSADELFSGGILLPLHLLHSRPDPEPSSSDRHVQPDPQSETGIGPELVPESSTTVLSASKRWTEIFKKTPAKTRDERRKKTSQPKVNQAELNINIWPFSRSRSAGNKGIRTRLPFGPPRKVSSAPCSRSNSSGDSNSRKWSSSPGRPGIYVGRASPVWQIRREGSGVKSSKSVVWSSEQNGIKKEKINNTKSGNSKVGNKVLGFSVPMCIGYSKNSRCKESGNSGGGDTVFGLRSLFFTKKVYSGNEGLFVK